jgi:hypothetical protein
MQPVAQVQALWPAVLQTGTADRNRQRMACSAMPASPTISKSPGSWNWVVLQPPTQAAAYPPMRPLVLVLKAYLRSCGLNDVAYGGLSSYSLCNMVVAHLQEELKVRGELRMHASIIVYL